MIVTTRYPDYLSHHGIKGQKWGVRRFQNADGSLTEAGKARQAKLYKKIDKSYEWSTRRNRKIANRGNSKLNLDQDKPLSNKDFKRLMKETNYRSA